MKREYQEDFEFHRYIWRNYKWALAEREQALYSAAVLELKARLSRSSTLANRFRKMPGYFYDTDVAAIVEGGLRAYEQRCCDRLLRDHAEEIYINRCERCHRIVASPIACACVWCGHHWYERRGEMIAHATSPIYPRSVDA